MKNYIRLFITELYKITIKKKITLKIIILHISDETVIL